MKVVLRESGHVDCVLSGTGCAWPSPVNALSVKMQRGNGNTGGGSSETVGVFSWFALFWVWLIVSLALSFYIFAKRSFSSPSLTFLKLELPGHGAQASELPWIKGSLPKLSMVAELWFLRLLCFLLLA